MSGARYFHKGNVLLDLLCSCDTIISGSTALHLLMPKQGPTWSPSDLDIYIPPAHVNTDAQPLEMRGL
ncbi:hypothetical protein BKA83DRAFT_4052984 [Pisolithus microcarpus]|nr:hypothetical protein BKA83DRAFT_4052984 [Pisolithus microcarpus]